MEFSRRKFIKTTALTGAFIPFADAFSAGIGMSKPLRSKICFFTKPLDNFETEFMAETLAMAGVDGFELTVRRGGKVDPEKVAEELPKVVELGKKYRLTTDMMVTGITGTEDKITEEILKTASSLGIKHYRLGYYSYDYSAGIVKSLETIKSRMKNLSEMNRQYNIQGGYQNHDGSRFGAPLWDLWSLIKDFPVETICSQYDIRHAIAEGHGSWIIGLHLLSKNIGAVAIKDFTWQVEKGKARTVHVPLGEGIVDFDQFFKVKKELKIDVPMSFHIEYPLLDKSEESYSLIQKQRIIVSKIKKDLEFIRKHEII
jgi:L-ribulose-5-phosphate 3-epimerase